MGLGFTELIMILVITLILFGPGKMPENGRAHGTGIREFKKAQHDLMNNSEEPQQTLPQPSFRNEIPASVHSENAGSAKVHGSESGSDPAQESGEKLS